MVKAKPHSDLKRWNSSLKPAEERGFLH